MTTPATSPCRTCGRLIPRTRRPNGGLAPPTHYCSNDCKLRCTIVGCNRRIKARGLCHMHYDRQARTGDVGPAERIKPDRGEGLIGYVAAHKRVYRERGRAADNPCTDCGQPATQWSYDYTAGEHELAQCMDDVWLYFSPNPDHYQARCLPCHVHHDEAVDGYHRKLKRHLSYLVPEDIDVVATIDHRIFVGDEEWT